MLCGSGRGELTLSQALFFVAELQTDGKQTATNRPAGGAALLCLETASPTGQLFVAGRVVEVDRIRRRSEAGATEDGRPMGPDS